MNKFLLACIGFLCILSTNVYSSDSFSNVNSLMALTGSGACSPTIVCPPDVTINGGIQDINQNQVPSASVAYSYCGTPSLSYDDKISGTACLTEITRLWTASSFNALTGNPDISQCRQQISLLPACQLVCPPSACIDVSDDSSSASLGTPTSSGSDCLITEFWSDDIESNLCDDVRRINRVWHANFTGYDGCSITCIQTITIGDTEAPILSNLPTNITVSSTCEIVQWEEPIANDNCLITTVTSNYRPGSSEFSVGNNIVTYDAIDHCGNVSSYSFNVAVLNDGTHPQCPANINIVTDDINPIVVDWDVPEYTGTCTECPAARPLGGFNFVGSMEGSNYYISTVGYYYDDARTTAQRLGGHIVSIGSDAENQFISDKFMSHSVFIGLTDRGNEGQFTWDSGEVLTYTNWSYNQPNDHNNNQDYVEMMSSGEWNDIDDKKLCFILEMPCDYVQQVGGPRLGDALFSGTYTVSYTIEDGCGLLQCCSFDITIEFDPNSSERESNENTESVENLEVVELVEPVVPEESTLSEITVYPNPFNEDITIEIPDFYNVKVIDVMTSDGKVAKRFRQTSRINKVSLSELNQGLHIAMIQYHNGDIKYKKIIKL